MPVKQIMSLWRAGYDTFDIARLLKLQESEVYAVVSRREPSP